MANKAPVTMIEKNQEFQTSNVLSISFAHFVHDVYSAFVAPLLPVLIEKLSLSLTAAGSLTAIFQLPSILNPLIGYIADKVHVRYFVIFAPAVTATLISMVGLAPNYFTLAIILFVAGISVASFHAPAPAMVARVSGNQVGRGMSLFMAGGELGRTVGPLLAVWAVSTWTLEGSYRIVVLGWAATVVLFFRIRNIPIRMEKPGKLENLRPILISLFIPLFFILFFRNFLSVSLGTYLPIFMNQKGGSLWVGGGALSILEIAGVLGALTSGTISDLIGRKTILLITAILGALFMFLFLRIDGWGTVLMLFLMGFVVLSTTPVVLAIVQDNMPRNRAVGNGLYMMMAFLIRPLSLISIGYLGDKLGLEKVYFWSAAISLLAIPAILALPSKSMNEAEKRETD